MKFTLLIPVLIITVYLLTNLLVPPAFSGNMIFLVDALLWIIPLVATILITKMRQTEVWHTDKTVIQLASIVAVFQIFMLIFVSFFMGFGRNPILWTPTALTFYFPFLVMPFLAIEFSRAYIAANISPRRPTLALLLVSTFYTLIIPTIPTYLGLASPLSIAEFLIRTFIPNLSISLLATYFAYLGGFPANIIYMAIPTFFTWFSPILPNPSWEAQSMITVIAAGIGFLVLDQTVRPLPTHKTRRRTFKKQRSQLPYWTAIALIGLVAVWSSTGLLGFTPTIIASGSMTPTLKPGDITIIISAPPQTIKIGDIIQYRTADMMVIHRVIDKYEAGGSLWFVTKGDANNAPDDPVNERQVMGKVVFTIPQLGWVSVALKNFATNTYAFLTTTVPQTLARAWTWVTVNILYVTSALTFAAYSYLLLTYINIKRGKHK